MDPSLTQGTKVSSTERVYSSQRPFVLPGRDHASCQLSGLLQDEGISMVTEFNTGEVDGRGGRLISYDGREVPFDLAVLVPLDGGQANVDCSPGLGD
jgi:hypothetical protein